MSSDSPQYDGAPPGLTRIAVGIGLLTAGGPLLFCIYGFASMVDPELEGLDYWRVVLRKMFLSTEGVVSVLGVVMIVAGLWLVVTGMIARRRHAGRPT